MMTRRIEVPDPFAGLEPLVARLVVDTIGPRGGGTRGPRPRHLLYEVGRFYLDLLQDQNVDTGETVIMGQLASAAGGESVLAGAPVIIERAGSRLGGTFCGAQGEFVLQTPLRHESRLRIKVGERHFADVPLDPPLTDGS